MLADKIFHYSYSQIDEHKPAEFCSLALKNSLRLDLRSEERRVGKECGS